MIVVYGPVTVAAFDNETTASNQQTEITAKTAPYLIKVSFAFRLPDTQIHMHTHTCAFAKAKYALYTSKPENQKAFVFMGRV